MPVIRVPILGRMVTCFAIEHDQNMTNKNFRSDFIFIKNVKRMKIEIHYLHKSESKKQRIGKIK